MRLRITLLLFAVLATTCFVLPLYDQPAAAEGIDCVNRKTEPGAVWEEEYRCLKTAHDGIERPVVLTVDVTVAPFHPTPAAVSSAGPDRTAFANETLSLDGTGASGWFDGLQADGRYSSRWDFGYGGFTYEGGDVAPNAYPKAGTYTVTRTVCDQAGSCASDTATITVSEISCTTQTSISDSGNPTQNMTALQAEVDASTGTNTKCINLPAGAIFRGNLILKHRTVANYLTIRTASFGSLPDGTTRVSPIHAPIMAIMEVANNSIIVATPATSSNPARYYNFLGIHFRKTDPAFKYNSGQFVVLGQANETSLAQLPNHIGFDRCYFDGGSTTSDTWRAVRFHGASDSWVVNSYLHRFKGVALETQAVFIGSGERDAFINNYMQGASECFLSGGARPSNITNHVPTDVVLRRNFMEKDLGWCSFCGSYYGTDMSVKNLLELKLGKRFSIQGNRFANHWAEDQNWAIVFTVRGEDGTVPWGNITEVDFAFNRIVKVGNGSQILGKDYSGASGIMDHLLIRQNSWAGISYYNGFKNTFVIVDGNTATSVGGGNFIMLVRNSTDQNGNPGDGQGRWILFEDSTRFTNFHAWGNVAQGYITGPQGSTGANAFNLATGGSFSVKKNGFYRSQGSNPSDNSSVSLITDVKYLSLPGFDLSLMSDSPFLATGLDGERAGVDATTLNTLTLGTITGLWAAAPTPTPTPTPSPTATPTPTPSPTATPTPTPTPTPNPSPSPTPTPGPICRPNELISTGCTCTTRVVGPPNKRRCK